MALNLFEPAICSIGYCIVSVELPRDFELLQTLSERAIILEILMVDYGCEKVPAKEVQKNSHSVTKKFNVKKNIKYQFLKEVFDIFNNIEDLELKNIEFEEN